MVAPPPQTPRIRPRAHSVPACGRVGPARGRLLIALSVLACVAFASQAHAEPSAFGRLVITETGASAVLPGEHHARRLTIDPALQRTAERLLARARAPEAAIVASDVRTGRILVWATRGSGRDFVSSAWAPSASLFKIVTAAALLDGGKATQRTRQCYAGGESRILATDLVENASADTVCTTVGEALGHSVNLVFAKLAVKHLEPSDLHAMATRLGFEGEPPIDVRVGSSELRIPDDRLGMARSSAGFWNGRLTPLGALFAMQTIANGGERIRLSLLDEGPAQRISLGRAMREETARSLREMLEVTTKRGTCARVFHDRTGRRVLRGMPVAAKTGTLVGGEPTRMFSWFASFAPANDPQIAVTVLLANRTSWWVKANEIGRDFLDSYFEGKRSSAARSKTIARRR